MKKTTAIITTILILSLSHASTTKAEPILFNDVPTSNPYFTAIMELVKEGAIKGFPDNTFQPDQLVTRAEFIKIFLRDTLTIKDREENCFKDVKSADWFSRDVCKAKKANVTRGYADGTFRPNRSVILAELLKIAIDGERVIRKGNIPAPNYIQAPPNWYDPYFDTANSYNLKPDTLTDPEHKVTRGETAQIVYNIKRFSKLQAAPPPTAEQFNYTPYEPIKPTVIKTDAEKAEDTYIPPSDTSEIKSKILIAGTEYNQVTRYVFNVGLDPMRIETIQLENAISETSGTIKKAYLKFNNKLLNSFFSGDGTARFSQMDYSIPKDKTGVVDVFIDLSDFSSTGLPTGTRIQVNLDTTPASNFRAVGLFTSNTYDGSTFTIAPGKIMTIRKSIPEIVSNTDNLHLNYGMNQVVYKFDARANSKGDVSIKKITLNASSDGLDTGENSIGKENGWRLWADGEQIATATLTNGKVTFIMPDEKVISRSRFTTFEVVTQIQKTSGANSPRMTISFVKDESEAADSTNGDNTGTIGQVLNAFNNFIWSDLSDKVGEREDWTNAYLLPGIMNSQSFTITE